MRMIIKCLFAWIILLFIISPSVSDYDFDQVFNDVLEITIREQWMYECPGTLPWDGGSLEDLGMATGILYDLEGEEYINKANISVETELWLIDQILLGNGEEWAYVIMNVPTLINGINNYSGLHQNKQKINLYSRAICILGSLIAIEHHSKIGEYFYSPIVFLGAVADVNFMLYEKTGNRFYIRLGISVLDSAESYWVTTQYGSYYSSNKWGNPWDFEIANILIPMIKAGYYGRRNDFLDKVTQMFSVMETHLWDYERGGYFANVEHTAKGLSNNLFCQRAHKARYKFLRLSFDYQQMESIFQFCIEDLYDGEGHILHDIKGEDVSDGFCVGCQLFFLDELYDFLNR